MTSDERDAVESPELEENGSAGGGGVAGESDSDDDQQVMPDPYVAAAADLNSPLDSATAEDTVTVALPSGSSLPAAAIPVDSDPKRRRATEIIHLRPPPPPPIDVSRRLFQRLWTDEDEIELLRGFLDYVTCHLEASARVQQEPVRGEASSAEEEIWNQTGKIIGFEDNNVIDLEEQPSSTNVDVDSDNVLEKKGTVSRKRSRSRIGRIDEDNKPISLSDGPTASGAGANENVAAFGDGRSLGGLIEETVKNCVSPLIKEMMMAAAGGYPGGGGHGMGVLSPMLMAKIGFGGGGGKGGVGDERWRRQQILELEVYSRRLELVQEQIRATLHELKTMPSGR
ncbi:BnaAnng29040D [Brassica napus]|uniref:BnaAnng29040D protein n=1 Tax=Brassica napus TaxID=3708 RepID=A0A078JTL6_BRANA|nr:BnaAnng29040D [Brassica napus]